MSDNVKRELLRHFLATLAYRGNKLLRDLPTEIADFRPGEEVRTAVEILNHVNGVLTYAHSYLVQYESTRPVLADWETEVRRFFDILAALDESLNADTPIREVQPEQLLQGPFADAMLHLGQIGILRRLAGSPVAAENYLFAPIRAGHVARRT